MSLTALGLGSPHSLTNEDNRKWADFFQGTMFEKEMITHEKIMEVYPEINVDAPFKRLKVKLNGKKYPVLEIDASFEEYFNQLISGRNGMDQKLNKMLFPEGIWKNSESWDAEEGKENSYSRRYFYTDKIQWPIGTQDMLVKQTIRKVKDGWYLLKNSGGMEKQSDREMETNTIISFQDVNGKLYIESFYALSFTGNSWMISVAKPVVRRLAPKEIKAGHQKIVRVILENFKSPLTQEKHA
jgi:hypothetical protein